MNFCIGLFGTCGGSRWRDAFISAYNDHRIAWYNPQVEEWDPSCADIEADHLANDAIILFPVTNETYAFGSLAETGFSILQALRLDDRREFVLYVAKDIAPFDPKGNVLDDRLLPDGSPNEASRAKESLRARALVRQHLIKLRLPNVYLVDTLEEMLAVSLRLWETAKIRLELEHYNPHRR
jgi:hypothetical protein